jgi:hypothetical protein
MDSITPSDRMMTMKMMTDRGNLQFNVSSEPQQDLVFLTSQSLCLVRGDERVLARGKILTGSSPD